ncbi:MAG TPA: VCBS repeat-containing protein [Saprospiraceae bacterium]|nr:VCBS repeat-containing protein [Saprospiraceae bacterium]
MNYFPKVLVFVGLIAISYSFYACKTQTRTSGEKQFTLLPPSQTGISFKNPIKETREEFIDNFTYIFNGGGVAVADFNNDGLQDLYFTGNQVSDKLYINKGDFKFEDISEKCGISKFKGWKSGVSIIDINGDGFQDIYVCRGGSKQSPLENTNLLFINQGNLTFRESAEQYGVNDIGFSIQSVFFDMDNDHDLDLYVANRPSLFDYYFKEVEYYKKLADPTTTDQLYLNEGNGKFKNITAGSGILPNFGFGLNVIAGDLNQDGFQDLYVTNDFAENDYCYINQQNGTFKHSIQEIANHTSFSSMGSDLGDINNDGYEDLFIAEMRPEDYKRSKTSMPAMSTETYDSLLLLNIGLQFMHNSLLVSHGNGFYSEISQLAHLDKTEWSWAPLIADFDDDGLKDLYITNGYKRDVLDRDMTAEIKKMRNSKTSFTSFDEAMSKFPTVKVVNYMFQNQDSFRFKKVMKDWGFEEPSYSNGAATADLDNDGDLDIIVNNIEDFPFIYKNNNPRNHDNVHIKIKGPGENPQGIGTKVTVYTNKGIQHGEIRSTRGYLSSSEAMLHVGLGTDTKIEKINCTFLDGKVIELASPKSSKHIITLDYKQAQDKKNEPKSVQYFTEMIGENAPIQYIHKENSFDDFKNQILLPHRLSKLGPFMSLGDLNKDGLDDVFIGGARNQAASCFLQNQDGRFSPTSAQVFLKDAVYEDMRSLMIDFDMDGDQDLYVVSGGVDLEEGKIYQDRLYLNDGKGNLSKCTDCLPEITSSGSTVSAYDWDKDGDLDLFRGGRAIPNKYPFAPKSYLLLNDGKGHFKDISHTAPDLQNAGMVITSCWMNCDDDAQKELILGGEWMGIEVHEYENGKWTEIPAETLGLTNLTGWWSKLVAFDIDDDGDEDLLCGNLGENYKFHATAEKPFSIYCNDFDKNGVYDIVLAKYNGNDLVPIRGKQCSQEQMPFIKTKFPSYNSFANANLKEIYGEDLEKGISYKAEEYRSMVLIQENGKFIRDVLPVEAQFSCIKDFELMDLDRDGKQEIILAGNRFHPEIETTPSDASIGLVLKRSANAWKIIPFKQSGLFLKTDVKDLAKIKIKNEDYLLVTNNDSKLNCLKLN